MFDFRSFFTSSIAAPSTQADRVRILAVTGSQHDAHSLREIAASLGWDLALAASGSNALEILRVTPTPLVICDRDLPDRSWKELVPQISDLIQPVCVLLASNVVDQNLHDEAIRYRGYDVVRKPFDREELRRVVKFAWSWQTWAATHHARAGEQPRC